MALGSTVDGRSVTNKGGSQRQSKHDVIVRGGVASYTGIMMYRPITSRIITRHKKRRIPDMSFIGRGVASLGPLGGGGVLLPGLFKTIKGGQTVYKALNVSSTIYILNSISSVLQSWCCLWATQVTYFVLPMD